MLLHYLFLGAFYANDKEMLLLRLNYIKITSVCFMFIHVISRAATLDFLSCSYTGFVTVPIEVFLCLHERVEDEWWKMWEWPQTQANGGACVSTMSPCLLVTS